ncbi:adenine phosphoribosyltransferase [Myxococcota bacterium]|nr:adenine phosphoribosyltransferase [Myxococcota bacterium]
MSIILDNIRDIPDFPKPGILFKDITPLLANPDAFGHVIELLTAHYKNMQISKVIGVESRGFIFGAPLAYSLGVGFVPVRKPGKLPHKTLKESYELEYGFDTIEIHAEDIQPNERVLVIDDLLATGGTAAAVGRLLEKLQAHVVSFAFLIELSFLNGRQKLAGHEIFSIVQY